MLVWLRRLAKLTIALALIVYLATLANHDDVAAAWNHVGPQTLLLACGCYVCATVLSAHRWQLLLRYQGMKQSLPRLVETYFIGLFCGLFLPTAAGGDAFRVYDVSRRAGPAAKVLLATLQDRLVGLGAAMLLGLIGAVCFYRVIPEQMLTIVVVIYSLGLLAVAATLYQRPIMWLMRHWKLAWLLPRVGERFTKWKAVERAKQFLQPLSNVKVLRLTRITRVWALALTTFCFSVAMHAVVCNALGASCELLALAVVASLVSVARMVPLTPNGTGVGEGAFVFVIGLFGVAAEQAAPAALALLGVQTVMSLAGGLLLLRRTIMENVGRPSQAVHHEKDGLGRPSYIDSHNTVLACRTAAWNGEAPSVMPLKSNPSVGFAEIPVAILAGGLATRLQPITHKIPKAMVEVAGRPFIDHQLELLSRNGVRRVVLCLGHLGEQVASHVGNGSQFGLDVSYSLDGEKLLGTGGALRRALPLLGEVCWVLYGDSYMDIDYRAVYRSFQRQNALGLMTVLRNNNQWDRSNVVFQDGKLLCYDKRQTRPEMEHIDYGVSVFRRAALECIPDNVVNDVADLMHDLVQRGEMAGFEVFNRFYEIGSPQGLQETGQHLERAAKLSA